MEKSRVVRRIKREEVRGCREVRREIHRGLVVGYVAELFDGAVE